MTASEQEVDPGTEAPEVPPAGPAKGKVTKNAATAPKSKKPSEPAGDKKVPAHPPTSQLVTEAIGKLNERGGSSLIAIKKSIADSHEVDVEKIAPLIRKFLKSGVEKGTLVQIKGKGATGSFKLAQKEKKVKEPAAVAEKKPKASKAPGVVKMKKPPAASVKKAAVKSKAAQKPAALKAKAVKAVKSKGPAKPKASKTPKLAEPEAEKAPKAPAAEKKPKPSTAVKAKAASSKKTKAPAKPRATRKAATAAPSI